MANNRGQSRTTMNFRTLTSRQPWTVADSGGQWWTVVDMSAAVSWTGGYALSGAGDSY
jgi:hypothetical protein